MALFSLQADSQEIEVRHYVINASPVGLTRSVKKIVKANIPNLNRFQDIADFVLGAHEGSDSEMEDTPENRVTLPQDFVGRGNRKSHKSALRLQEMGPRLRLKLLKIEEQVGDGKVLYHAFMTKTPEEIERLQRQKTQKVAEKAKRRAEQAANLTKKGKNKKAAVEAEDDGEAPRADTRGDSDDGADDDEDDLDDDGSDADEDDQSDADDDVEIDDDEFDGADAAEDGADDDDSDEEPQPKTALPQGQHAGVKRTMQSVPVQARPAAARLPSGSFKFVKRK